MEKSSNPKRDGGFSLVEVVLAIGVFALTIVAVIGLLGPIAQQVRDLQDTKVANSLPSPIREELNRIGFQYFVDDAFTETENLPTSLVASMDGSRVIGYTGDFSNLGTVIPRDGVTPTGIDVNDQYFAIELTEGTGNLDYNAGDAHVAFLVEISWPYRLPDGTIVDLEDRQTFEYPTAIVVGEPF
tara:strand:- start:3485 stop:4039 length:555 start_codon:yes stop_codon:yes gene_type:complete